MDREGGRREREEGEEEEVRLTLVFYLVFNLLNKNSFSCSKHN